MIGQINWTMLARLVIVILVAVAIVGAFTITWVLQWIVLTAILLGVFVGVATALDGLAYAITYWRVRRDARKRNPGQGYHAHYDPISTGKIDPRKGRGDK